MADNNKPFSIPFSFHSSPLTNTEFMVVNITPIVLLKWEKDFKIIRSCCYCDYRKYWLVLNDEWYHEISYFASNYFSLKYKMFSFSLFLYPSRILLYFILEFSLKIPFLSMLFFKLWEIFPRQFLQANTYMTKNESRGNTTRHLIWDCKA